MKNIPHDFLSTFLDNMDGHYRIHAQVRLKPIAVKNNVFVFSKFIADPNLNIIFERIDNENQRAISALSCSGVDVSDSGFVDVSFEIFTSVKKILSNGNFGEFAKCSLYTREYLLIQESFNCLPVVICRRRNADDIELSFEFPNLFDDQIMKGGLITDNLVCGTLSINDYFINLQMKYAYRCTDCSKLRSHKAAAMISFVALKSLIN